jgi:hypothetical protein
MAVEDDWEEMTRKELGYKKETSCVLQLQWDWYNYCVKIRCQDTTSEDREPLCVCARAQQWTVKCVDQR